jgi:2-polyprenyl-6-methoxyphenol hydroxylase-like FAD-dependent oxidoreductase
MQSTANQVQVLIVGAGPTGLTLACDLARRNIHFRLIDKAPSYFAGSRGKGLQPRSLEVFDDLGIVERILSCGRFHLPFRSYDGATVLGDRDLNEGFHPTPDTPYASSLITPQWRTEETLRTLLESYGRKVELGSELTHIEQDEEGVTATVTTEHGTEQIRAQYLVGADGGRSFTRKFLQIGFEGDSWNGARMFVGDVRVQGLDRDHWHTWPNHPDGWLALCPLPSTDSFQLQAGIPWQEEKQEPTLAAFQKIVDERARGADLKLADPTWLSLYSVNVRMVDRYRVGRVFLAGDAAHVHPPTGGQGLNTGVQDAYNLGWKLGLVLGGAHPALLDSYEEERLPVAASVLGLTTRLSQEFFANKNQLTRSQDTRQLGINYRKSSLTEGIPGRAEDSLQAGDRAPDGLLTNGSGARIRIFDLLRGPHFTVLRLVSSGGRELGELQTPFGEQVRTFEIATERTPASENLPAQLWAEDDQLWKTYGIERSALVVIRPDGYIGWMGDGDSLSDAESYLTKIIGGRSEGKRLAPAASSR